MKKSKFTYGDKIRIKKTGQVGFISSIPGGNYWLPQWWSDLFTRNRYYINFEGDKSGHSIMVYESQIKKA